MTVLVLGIRRAAACAAAAAAVVAIAPAAAQAATWTVNTNDDPPGAGCTGGVCSIRQALTAAAPGDTIVVPGSASHYRVAQGELTVSKPVALQGGGESATIIDALGTSRVMRVDTGVGTTTLSGLTLTGGSVTASGPSQGGGGILVATGGLWLNDTSVSGNSAAINPAGGADGGGGILDLGGALTLSGATVTRNSLSVSDPTAGSDGGGGIYVNAGLSMAITGSTLAGNTATITAAGGSDGGGGIYDQAGSSTYVNDTFTANSLSLQGSTASSGGGAIFHQGPSGTISDATIAQNSSNAGAGGIHDDAGPYTLKNTIVAQNGTGCAGPAGVLSAGYNLEGSATCNMTMPTDLRNTNPQLGPLTDNGGPTQTMALTPASPAIDAGSCTDASGSSVGADQRGVARPQPAGGRCDIGAFEYVPASPAPLIVGGSRPLVNGSTSATFAGVVNPGGLQTVVRFAYGLDARYRPPGRRVVVYDHFTPPVRIFGGYAPARIVSTAGRLVPAALYHVHLLVANGAGTVIGPDQTFVTAKDRPPRRPVLGAYINAAPANGLVRVRIGGTFVPLTEPRRLPAATEFDARFGSVVVSAAGVAGGMTGTFSGAVFKLTQAASGPSRGAVTVAIVDGAFAGVPSYAGCRRRNARVLQTLHANVGARFRIAGRFSAGVARAGQWATSDRCDGTLTSVRRGSVLVTGLLRNSTVTVRGGHAYLARRG